MAPIATLTHREETEIGVMIASELIDYVFDGKLTPSKIRETLRQVVREIGNAHTDEHLASLTIQRLRQDLRSRI